MTIEQIARAVSSSTSTVYRDVEVDGRWVPDDPNRPQQGQQSPS